MRGLRRELADEPLRRGAGALSSEPERDDGADTARPAGAAARDVAPPPPAEDPRAAGPDAAILAEAGPGLPPWSGPPPRIDVLHLDEHLVVASKPPGLLVHRVSGSDEKVVLLQTLRDQLGRRLYPVQRLDRPASGVIAFGLSSAAAAALQERLQQDAARKEYVVLARGECPARFESRRPLQGASGQLQDAWSQFETLARTGGLSLLRARLRTGRTHQLRRHLAHLGHPIAGDTTYGRPGLDLALREAHGLARLFLHAARLVVLHPASDEPLDLRAPLAPDLRAALASLGLDAALADEARPPEAPPAGP